MWDSEKWTQGSTKFWVVRELQSHLNLDRLKYKRSGVNQKFISHKLVYTGNIEFFEIIPSSLIPYVLTMIVDHATHNDKRTDVEAR